MRKLLTILLLGLSLQADTYLLVVNEGDETIDRVNLDTNVTDASWIGDNFSYPKDIETYGGYAYVADYANNQIDRINLMTKVVDNGWASVTHPYRLATDGSYLYVTSASTVMARIRLSDADTNTTWASGFERASGITIAAGKAYVTEYANSFYDPDSGHIDRVDLSSATREDRWYDDVADAVAALGPTSIANDGTYLYVVDGDQVDRLSIDQSSAINAFATPGTGTVLDIEYHRGRLYVMSYDENSVYEVNASNAATLRIYSGFDIPAGLAVYTTDPFVTSTPPTTVTQDVPYSYTPSATDVDGDTLSWSATPGTTLPSWLGLQENATWTGVGSAGFSASQAPETSLVIDSGGTPYVAYQDAASSGKATVKRYDGTNWVSVGSAGFSADSAVGISLAIDGSDTLYVAYRDIGNGAKATVMKFDGANWVNVGSAGFSAGEVWDIALAVSGSGTPYVVYQDRNMAYRATVMKFDGSNWVNVGSEGFSAGEVSANTIAIDSGGTAYVGYQDEGNGYKATVMKFDGSSWVNVGSAGFSAGVVSSPSLAIDGSNRPYFAYTDEANGNRATVMRFDGTNWVTLGNAGFSAGQATYNSIAIRSGNTPYVAYSDGGNGDKATVMKFDGTNWVSVGTPGMSADGADFTSIAFDGSGVLYLAYRDWSNSYKATVMKTVGFLSLEGTPGSGDVGVHDVNLTVSDGNGGSAAHNFQITVANVNDAPTGIALSLTTIAENSVVGTAIGTLSTTDADAGDTHTYSFTCNAPTGAEGNFNISAATLQSGISFDFETAQSYTLCIRTTDLSGATYDANVTVTITNVNESVDGVCGSADGSTFNTAPATNLCSSGSASSVTENSNSYDWSCNGTTVGGDAGASTACSATRAVLPGTLYLSSNTIVENSAAGTSVGTLSADGNVTGFGFCGGADDAEFAISGNTLQTAVSLDYESGATRTVCIRAAYTTYGAAKLRAGTGTLDQNFTITLINDASDDAANAAVSVPLFGIPGMALLGLLIGLFGVRRLGRDAYM